MIKVANNLNYFIRTKRALGETLTEPVATSPVEAPRARGIHRFSPRPPEHPFEHPAAEDPNYKQPTRSWRDLATEAYGGDTDLVNRMLAETSKAQKNLGARLPPDQQTWIPQYHPKALDVSIPVYSKSLLNSNVTVNAKSKDLPGHFAIEGDQGDFNVFGLTPDEQRGLKLIPITPKAGPLDEPLSVSLGRYGPDSSTTGIHEATHLMRTPGMSGNMDPYLTGVPGVKSPAEGTRTTKSHGMKVREFPAHLSEMKNMFWRDTGIEPIFDSPEKVQQFNEYMNELQKTYPGSKDRHGEIMQYFQDMNNPDMQAQYLNSVVQNDNKGRNQAPYSHYQTA